MSEYCYNFVRMLLSRFIKIFPVD